MNATHEIEVWRPIVGHEGVYEVSSLGRVRSLDRINVSRNGVVRRFRGRVLAQNTANTGGYPSVGLANGGGQSTVHTLMLEAFVGPRPPGDTHGRHLNDVSTDNRLGNLEWGTRSQNMRDAVKNHRHANASKTHCDGGHEFTPENTYIQRQRSGASFRACRKCRKQWSRNNYEAKKRQRQEVKR